VIPIALTPEPQSDIVGLERIIEVLEDDTKKAIASIISDAKNEAKRILQNAKLEAKRIREEHERISEQKLKSQITDILSNANIDSRKLILQTKEDIIEKCFEEAKRKLKDARKNKKKYEKTFQRLTSECLKEMESKKNVIVRVDKRDERLVKKLFKKSKLNFVIKSDINTLGGLILISENGKTVVDNTLDSRLVRAKELMKPEIARLLFVSR